MKSLKFTCFVAVFLSLFFSGTVLALESEIPPIVNPKPSSSNNFSDKKNSTKQIEVKSNNITLDSNKSNAEKVTNVKKVDNKKFNRSGVYLAVDLLRSISQHKYIYSGAEEDVDRELKVTGNNNGFGVGLSLGYKIAFGNAFIAPEIFYDRLENSSKGFPGGNKSNSNNLNQRYGGKIYLGYNLFNRLNLFVNAGVANINYNLLFYAGDSEFSEIKKIAFSPIYGAGFSLVLDENWQARFSYDEQSFDVRYFSDEEKDKITLRTARIGLVYNF